MFFFSDLVPTSAFSLNWFLSLSSRAFRILFSINTMKMNKHLTSLFSNLSKLLSLPFSSFLIHSDLNASQNSSYSLCSNRSLSPMQNYQQISLSFLKNWMSLFQWILSMHPGFFSSVYFLMMRQFRSYFRGYQRVNPLNSQDQRLISLEERSKDLVDYLVPCLEKRSKRVRVSSNSRMRRGNFTVNSSISLPSLCLKSENTLQYLGALLRFLPLAHCFLI